MKLRSLEKKDAPYMLEWMHDSDVVEFLSADFSAKTLEDCENFIKSANLKSEKEKNMHFAICDDDDEYYGTISLKNIDRVNRIAEYAISTRKKSFGTGYAKKATDMLLQIAFEQQGLNKVYLYVDSNNTRAVQFYHKCCFELEGRLRAMRYHKETDSYSDYLLFGITKDEYQAKNNNM